MIEISLEKLHSIQLEILKEFVKLCDRYGLQYFMVGGSLIGAIRHKGFIPWDDDVDVAMPRKDYECLKASYYKHFPSHISIDISDILRPYDNRTLIKPVQLVLDDSSKIGISIDVLPIDGLPNSAILRKWHLKKILFCRALLHLSHVDTIVIAKTRRTIDNLIIRIGKFLHFERRICKRKSVERLHKLAQQYSVEESTHVGVLLGRFRDREVQKKETFGSGRFAVFENIYVRIPSDYDAYLKSTYGDYMTPPIPEKRISLHPVLVENMDDSLMEILESI